jgi:hypothetical protein
VILDIQEPKSFSPVKMEPFLKHFHKPKHKKIISVVDRSRGERDEYDSDYYEVLSTSDEHQTIQIAPISITFDSSVLFETTTLVAEGDILEIEIETVETGFFSTDSSSEKRDFAIFSFLPLSLHTDHSHLIHPTSLQTLQPSIPINNVAFPLLTHGHAYKQETRLSVFSGKQCGVDFMWRLFV